MAAWAETAHQSLFVGPVASPAANQAKMRIMFIMMYWKPTFVFSTCTVAYVGLFTPSQFDSML